MLATAQKRAKKGGFPCTITIDDILLPTHCPLLGIQLTARSTINDKNAAYSLDKIIPELGYVPGNVTVMSFKANAMKQDATPEQLLFFAKAILNQYGCDFNTYNNYE